MKIIRLMMLLVLALGGIGYASTPAMSATDETARIAELRRLRDSLHYQSGTITLADGLAKVSLEEHFRYLSPADTKTLLTKLWGNPEGGETLGTIVPDDFNPFAPESWAVVMTFAGDGYVKDDDANKIDYEQMMKDMKEGTAEANKARENAGYPSINLIGWAAPPRYDASSHKLYWAKELQFGSAKVHTLNYNIRVLGRRGVLVLNAVSTMSQLSRVERAAPTLLTMVDFQPGHRYSDFNDDTDKVATYGLAALVAGGVAAKAGLFKVLWVGLLAAKKFIVLGLIALAGAIKKFWAWIRGRSVSEDQPKPPAISQ